MPSEPMNIQEQGFRSSLFGFDKNDVLAYMNALANEAQQHELEYNRQLQQLQSKLDELRSERGTADSRMEALKAELAAATQRADTAEAKRREADEQLETIKKKTASFQSTQRESQKNANIWQLKCHDLQQQVDELQKQLTAAPRCRRQACRPVSRKARRASARQGQGTARAPHSPCRPGPPSAQHPPPDLPAFAGSDRQIGPGGAISLYIATRFCAGWFLFRTAPPGGKAWFVHKPFLIC